MTIAQWPEELPRPMRDGFERGFGETRLKLSTDAGIPKMRRRFTAAAHPLSMTLELERDQLARFERFFHEEVAQGSLPFAMPDPTLDGVPLADGDGAYLTDEDGALLTIAATWVVLFGDQLPSTTPMGNLWRVSFQLFILP